MTRQQAAAMEIAQAARQQSNQANFDSFNGGQQSRTVDLKGKSQHQLAQFNIVVNGNIAAAGIAASGSSTIATELFYAQNSASKINSQALNALLSNSSPIDGGIIVLPNALSSGTLVPYTFPTVGASTSQQSYIRGIGSGIANGASWGNNPATICGFDANGNLQFLMPTNGAAGLPALNISCRETSYRALFEYSAVHAFNIEKIRLTTTAANNGAQFQNTLYWAKATWLGGVEKQVISPQSFVTPFQQLNNIVDIVKTPIRIDRQKGIQVNINANELAGVYGGTGVVFTCFCDLYTRSEL